MELGHVVFCRDAPKGKGWMSFMHGPQSTCIFIVTPPFRVVRVFNCFSYFSRIQNINFLPLRVRGGMSFMHGCPLTTCISMLVAKHLKTEVDVHLSTSYPGYCMHIFSHMQLFLIEALIGQSGFRESNCATAPILFLLRRNVSHKHMAPDL